MKKMTSREIDEAIKKYNKIGYKKDNKGWYSKYTPIAVIGETEKSYRCVVIGEDMIGDDHDPNDTQYTMAYRETYKANSKKVSDKITTIPKRIFDKSFVTVRQEIRDWNR